jgi:hypothetical protein
VVLVIVAPLVALLYLIYVRVLLEIVIAVFRIMETNTELVALQRGHGGGRLGLRGSTDQRQRRLGSGPFPVYRPAWVVPEASRAGR